MTKTKLLPTATTPPPSGIREVVRLVSRIGPDIAAIARELNQPEDTVRYWFREKCVKRNIKVKAAIDDEKLGLRRTIFLAELAPQFVEDATRTFCELDDLGVWYLSYFNRTRPDDIFIIQTSVPVEFAEAHKGLFNELKERGFFTRLTEVGDLENFRNLPMNVDSYDFDRGRWEWDPNRIPVYGSNLPPRQRERFDITDLLILKELQIDADRSVLEISRKLDLNYKKALRHHGHVKEKGLVQNYMVDWLMGNHVPELKKVEAPAHRYLPYIIFGSGLTNREVAALSESVRRFPFLWSEAVGTNYWAQIVIPLDYVNEVLDGLQPAISSMKSKLTCRIAGFHDARKFTVAHKLFDQRQKRWTFDPGRVLTELDKLTERNERKLA